MQVYEVDPLSDRRWDALVESDPGSSIFHSRPWLQALKSTYNYTPAAFTTSPADGMLANALVFCRVDSWLTGSRLVSVPFADHCELLSTSLEESEELVLHARQPHARNGKPIELRPLTYKPADHQGFSPSAIYRMHSLALDRSKAELFRGFHKTSLQQRIRRAEREGLECEEGNSEGLLAKFYTLLLSTRRRHGIPPQPLSWFQNLIRLFGDKVKIRVASKDGLPIASILTLSHKQSLVYKYGCSDARFHPLGGIALLLWQAIQEAVDHGKQHLDMGRSSCDNEGLISFKERFGAVGASLVYWSYPGAKRQAADLGGHRVMRSLAQVSPDFALKMAGSLLYRHIG
jgi:hypothetical protein